MRWRGPGVGESSQPPAFFCPAASQQLNPPSYRRNFKSCPSSGVRWQAGKNIWCPGRNLVANIEFFELAQNKFWHVVNFGRICPSFAIGEKKFFFGAGFGTRSAHLPEVGHPEPTHLLPFTFFVHIFFGTKCLQNFRPKIDHSKVSPPEPLSPTTCGSVQTHQMDVRYQPFNIF